MGMGDAALTMAPFAKPIFNAMKRVPKTLAGLAELWSAACLPWMI